MLSEAHSKNRDQSDNEDFGQILLIWFDSNEYLDVLNYLRNRKAKWYPLLE